MKASKAAKRRYAVEARAPSTAFLAVHYQNDVLHADGKVRVALADDAQGVRTRVVKAAGILIAAARDAGVPVISIQACYRPDYREVIPNAPIFRTMVELRAFEEGSWGCAFHEGLGPRPDEFVVRHGRVNPFYGSPLESILQGLDVQRVVIAGLSTHSAVEHTARHAADIGYEVIVVEDGCSSADRATHEAAMRSMSFIATIMSTEAVVAGFANDWGCTAKATTYSQTALTAAFKNKWRAP